MPQSTNRHATQFSTVGCDIGSRSDRSSLMPALRTAWTHSRRVYLSGARSGFGGMHWRKWRLVTHS